MQGRLHFSDDDPLTRAIAPPPNESPEDRAARLYAEAEAQRISDEIDEFLKNDRAAWKKHKGLFKLLLLGQSESGKSTTLKNFQLTFAPQAWRAERASWRAVVQLNLVRSVNAILDVLTHELAPTTTSPVSSPHLRPSTNTPHSNYDSDSSTHHPNAVDTKPHSAPSLQFTSHHSLLKLRLAPLRRVEADLKRRLGAATDELAPDVSAFSPSVSASSTPEELMMATPFDSSYHKGPASEESAGSTDGHSTLDNATEVMAGCKDDMRELWGDPVIKDMLRRRKIRMEDSAGFFLNDIDRIATFTYEPSDDDVVRARLRTLGVQEYKIVMEQNAIEDVAREWLIYDVGGSRTSRSAWLPYFDDAKAILFLAPISCFDELLAEDRRVNRLEDSFVLWKSIVQSKLLAKCIIILFLNKYDLLEKKLKSGIKITKYLPSFGDRENSATVVAKYLHQKFRDQQREYSPEPGRPFYGYVTSVVDTRATSSTLASVRDGILRHNLQQADMV
ncbi:Guanine nucleotide-binding protein alpha-4 subunit [Grifola frondosa]|uniref:Guanine nucleotide-binding protein alpha-4 subunit n=1 Tax=Grifola frondosa TaxID=5627 RepID=A0A1C7MPY8_GRIFR|nr:Guanine nucleotide-binding protein alpha-4 subunit [Grifola frondosa]